MRSGGRGDSPTVGGSSAARGASPTAREPRAQAEHGPERIVPMRLQKFLARAGAASRRGSENLMTAGRVRVNGQVVSELGAKVDPLVDTVTVDGREVRLEQRAAYLILHKPVGYVTTMRDPQGRPCVASLVPTADHPGLFPVGRLDRDTTGILLFTTDGEAAQRLLHPSFEKDKHYVALVRGTLSASERRQLERGITLDDGPCAPARVEQMPSASPEAKAVAPKGVPERMSVVGLTIHEGRKHQVKRMLAAVGHEVVALHRDTFGPLRLGSLACGQWRMLDEHEVARVLAAAGRECARG